MDCIGLVTVLYRSNDVLEGFFKSLSNQTYKNYHLFLIDNSPSIECDQILDNLMVRYPIVKWTHIKNNENVGVAKGNNQGIELAMKNGYPYTLLLNNDIEFDDPDAIFKLQQTAQLHNESIIIPKILFYDTRRIWMAGGGYVYSKGITYHEGEGCLDDERFNSAKYFSYAPTCFMLIKNEVFKQIGLMDEKYFVYFDDTDFCYRAHINGFNILYNPEVSILHKVSSSTGGNRSLFTIFYANRNRLYFIRKNFRGLNYAIAFFVTIVSRGLLLIAYNKNERRELIKAIKAGLSL